MAIVAYNTVGALTTTPAADNLYDLGSSTLTWRSIYVTTSLTAGYYTVTSATIPVTGIYLAAGNSLGLAVNTTLGASLSTTALTFTGSYTIATTANGDLSLVPNGTGGIGLLTAAASTRAMFEYGTLSFSDVGTTPNSNVWGWETGSNGLSFGATTANTAMTATWMRGHVRVLASSTKNFTAAYGMRGFESYLQSASNINGTTITGAAHFITNTDFSNNATAFTVTNIYGYVAANLLAPGTGVTLTNMYGVYIEALTRATNNYGIYINTPTGTIARSIYIAGGAIEVVGVNFITDTTTGTKWGTATTQKQAWYNATPVVQQTLGGAITNNIVVSGTTRQLDDWTSLTVYSTDAAAIHNSVYQIGATLKTVVDALRTYGLLS